MLRSHNCKNPIVPGGFRKTPHLSLPKSASLLLVSARTRFEVSEHTRIQALLHTARHGNKNQTAGSHSRESRPFCLVPAEQVETSSPSSPVAALPGSSSSSLTSVRTRRFPFCGYSIQGSKLSSESGDATALGLRPKASPTFPGPHT